MSNEDVFEHFEKKIITSCSIVTSIFSPDYELRGDNIIVNDFIKRSSISSIQLTPNEISAIHRRNAGMEKSQYDPELEVNFVDDRSHEDNVIDGRLLDIYRISGNREQERQTELKKRSNFLHTYLSACLGTEKTVRLRRGFFSKIESQLYDPQFVSATVIGSKAEGFNFLSSDTDVLLYNEFISERGESAFADLIEYRSVSNDVQPGYVLIECVQEGGLHGYFTNTEAQKNIHEGRLKHLFSTIQHGPAQQISKCGKDLDQVFSFKSENWPHIATEWTTRKRGYGWPSEEMITNITKQGCHIVPVGSGREVKNTTEWRLSFSVAERELIWTFNHTQLLVYGLLKILLKEYISKSITDDPEVICSYFIKTVVFWVIEETPRHMWKPHNSISCYHACLKRLIQFLEDDNRPNYFIPSNNMFYKRFKEHDRKNMIQLLRQTYCNGLQWTSQTQTLKQFYFRLCNSKTETDRLHYTCKANEEIEKAWIFDDVVLHAKYMFFRNRKRARLLFGMPLLQGRLLPFLCHLIDTENCSIGNKMMYGLKALSLKLLTLPNQDEKSYILLAFWLFKENRFKECIDALELLSMKHCFGRCDDDKYSTFDIDENVLINKSRQQGILNNMILFPLNSLLTPKGLLTITTINNAKKYHVDFIGLPFSMCIVLLKFLCYHYLGDFRNRETAYQSIDQVTLEIDVYKLFKYYVKMYCFLVRHNMNFNDYVANMTTPDKLLSTLSTFDMFIDVDTLISYFMSMFKGSTLNPQAVQDISCLADSILNRNLDGQGHILLQEMNSIFDLLSP